MAESYFKINSNEIYENLIKISENLEESNDVRLQAISLLKRNFKIRFNNNYIKYKKVVNNNDMLVDESPEASYLALPQDKQEIREEVVLIDSLPYIDQHYKAENRVRDEMNRLIEQEMWKFEPNDYLTKYEKIDFNHHELLNKEFERLEKGNKLSVIKPNINTKFELPPPNKLNDEEYWERLNNQIDTALQHFNIKNFNLDLLIKYGTPSWKTFIANYETIISQLKKEKENLEKKNDEINQQRKFKQVFYN
jgi:hypothetical protein